MDYTTIATLLFPDSSSTIAASGLLVLRLTMSIAFIRHGWPKIRNLSTWAKAMNTPTILCGLSAYSMWLGGIALLPGFLTGPASLAILVSMAYAVILEISKGFPFIAPDPFQIPQGDYAGPMGVGDPPSWEKALLYVVMAAILICCGGGALSLDNEILKPILLGLAS